MSNFVLLCRASILFHFYPISGEPFPGLSRPTFMTTFVSSHSEKIQRFLVKCKDIFLATHIRWVVLFTYLHALCAGPHSTMAIGMDDDKVFLKPQASRKKFNVDMTKPIVPQARLERSPSSSQLLKGSVLYEKGFSCS